MGKRQLREEQIRTIVRNHPVRTQKDLADLLQQNGFVCTQATISRDISELGLMKSSEGFYVLPEDQHLERMVSDLVTMVQAASNLVVIKTRPGAAQGVCAAIDSAEMPGALGTVAGDDTILLAATDEDAAVNIEMLLKRFSC